MFAAHHQSRSFCRNASNTHPPGPPRRCIQQLRLPITGGCAGRTFGGPRIQPERPPSARRQTASHLPVESRSAAAYAPPREGPRAPESSRWKIARQGFRRGFAPGTTRARQRRDDCLAAPPPGSRRLLLAPRSQSSAFGSPGDRPGTGGTTAGRRAPSQVSVERPSASHVARDEPRIRWCAAGSPAGTVCGRAVNTPLGRFRGAEYRSAPLPVHQISSHFGLASLGGTDRQALAGLSWLSFSRSPDLPEIPGPGHGPVPSVARSGAPHAGAVERT